MTPQPTDLTRARALVRLLDQAFRIPGTRLRVGLDSIVGLVPGVGDVAGAVLAGSVVLVAARLGAPPSVLARMVGNIAVDTAIGMVPLLGDLFDVVFKASSRNLVLLEQHMDDPAAAHRASRSKVLAVAVGLAAFFALALAAAFLLVRALLGALG